jgi:glycosyltransferase involved in cell wall biosynthesis
VSVARPARIALVVGQLSTGGAEGQLRLLTRNIDRNRFEPIVYCLSSQIEPIGRLLRNDGIAVQVAGTMGWRRARWLADALAADKIDLVHAWLYIANAVAWAAGLFDMKRPLITSARNCKVQGRLSQFVNLLAFQRSTAIVVNSRDVAAYIVRHYRAPQERIRVIYNGIDTERFHPRQTADKAAPLVVTVGRLVEQKNHSLFLRAAARLVGDVPTARFVIVGDGPLRPALQEQAHNLGITDKVSFTGERSDVEEILYTASLFWLTSRWEGMPNVALEAMASGVPAIVTDVGGARELIRHGVDGFVVASGDVDAFVHYSRELLSDASLCQRFGEAARARAEELATPRMVSALSRLYDEVLGWSH